MSLPRMERTSIMKHKITLEEGARPIKECYRRVPPGLYDEVWKQVQEMNDVRAIQLSNSPWASAIVLVRKKNDILCKQFNKFINTLKKEKEEIKEKYPWLEQDDERRNMSDREILDK